MLARSRCSLARSAPVQRNARLVVRASSQKVEKTGKAELQSLVAPAVVTAVANAIMAMPAAADAGKLFDFNLTLPAMAGEFLLLMVFLDKTWFGPVGKVLDERDATIRCVPGNGSFARAGEPFDVSVHLETVLCI